MLPGRRLLWNGFLCLALSQPAGLAQQPTSGDRIAGRVVSAVDEHPLAGATVSLNETRNQQVVATTTADADGHYSFASVKPGKYRLTARAANFLPSSYLQHEQFSTAIVTGAGLPTDSLVLSLTPGATLSGTVLDQSGEPVQRAAVTLYRRAPNSTRVARFRNAQTDTDAAFEIANLPPGTYFLSATGTPWYAVHPRPDQDSQFAPYRASVDPALDVAYPVVFYPNALDSDDAEPIKITGGEQLTANMRLVPQHALNITLHSGPSDPPYQRMPMLMREVFGVEEPVPIQMSSTNGVQEITGITPGSYHLREFVGTTGMESNAVPIELAAGSTAVEVEIPKDLATVSVTARSGDGEDLPSPLQISLRSPESYSTGASKPLEKGAAEFETVPPGTYQFFAFARGRAMTVKSLSVNGKPADDRRVHVTGSSPVKAELTLSSESVRIEGVVQRDGKPDAGSMVLLVPAEPQAGEELFRRDQSDLDGSFVLNNVAPGNYILVSVDDGWKLRWNDLGSITPYLLHGTPVSVPVAGPNPIRLASPVTAQAR